MPNEHSILSQLIAHIKHWVWAKEIPSGKYLFVNEAFCDGSGLKCEDILGKTDQDLWNVEAAKHFFNRDSAVAESKAPIIVKEFTPGTHAERRYVETMKFPIFDGNGNVVAVGGIARDIQWEHDLEQYVQQAVQELEALVEVQKVTTLWEAVTSHGLTVGLIIVLVSILGAFIRSGLKFGFSVLKTKFDSFESSLKILERAAVSEEGQTISQARQMETLKQLYTDLTKHSEKCLTYHTELTNVTNDIAELRRDVDQFILDGKEARKLTQETVGKLGERLDTFMIKLLEITKNLTELGLRRGN